jgi:hypothetical protein
MSSSEIDSLLKTRLFLQTALLWYQKQVNLSGVTFKEYTE